MEEVVFKFAVIFQASSIALGVGSSTLAISSFLYAIANDNKIDPSERRMLGVIYWALRTAMFGIVLTTGCIHLVEPEFFGAVGLYVWILVGVLFGNALAMTKRWVSSKYGPALQAATWYTLGFLVTIHMFELFAVDYQTFIALYAADIVFTLILVNAVLRWVHKKHK